MLLHCCVYLYINWFYFIKYFVVFEKYSGLLILFCLFVMDVIYFVFEIICSPFVRLAGPKIRKMICFRPFIVLVVAGLLCIVSGDQLKAVVVVSKYRVTNFWLEYNIFLINFTSFWYKMISIVY